MADFSITGDVRLNSDPAEQSVNKWTVAAGQMIADFAQKAADALTSVVKSGLSYNRDMESYLTNFKVMLGDEQLAAEQLETIRKMAASTPFTLSDLTAGTQTLLQFGIAADDTTDVLKRLGDISLGNADKMQTLVRAYGKMSSAQKVTLENVNMMIDAGFNPLNQMCAATGESMSDLYKRISDGKVSFGELQAAVEAATNEGGQFYNGMLEASQTFNGRLSTLQDNVAALTGKLTDGLFAALGELIVQANALVVSVTEDDEKLAALKDTIGLVIAVVAAAGAAFLSYKGYLIATSAAAVVQTAATTALAAAHKAAEGGATGLAAAQAGLNAVLKANPIGLVISLVSALAAGLVTAYHTSSTFRDAVNSAFSSVQKIAQNAIGTVVDRINELVAKIKGAAAALSNLKSGLGAAKDAYNEAYTGAMDDYNQSKRDKAAARRKQLHDERVKQAQEEAAAAKAASETVSQSADSAAAAVDTASKKSSTSAKKAASEVVNSVTATSTVVENGITRTTETVTETLKNGTTQQKQTVTETSRQMVEGVLSDVKTITTTAADGSQSVQQSIEAVRDVVATTKDTQTQLIDGAKVTVETTTELLADGSEQISTVTTRTGKEIIDGVERTVKTVTTRTAEGVETTVRTIEDAGPQYASAGELLTSQLRQKLDDGWADIQSAIQEDALGAIGKLATALRDGDLESLGLWAASYFWQACTAEQQAQITSLAMGALNQLGSALSDVGGNLAQLAASLVAQFVPAAATATTGQQALNIAMDANPILFVISLIGMLVGALLSFAGTNKDVASGIKGVWAGVKDFLSVIFEGLLRIVGLGIQGFINMLNGLIATYNLVAQTWGGQIDYVQNPVWQFADKLAAARKKEQEERKKEAAKDDDPNKALTDAVQDNTEALLSANKKLAEMIRQANGLVLSDNMAVTRSVAASGTAQVAAAANQYHSATTNITQNIYSKAQTAADLQREARWEADRAKARKQ